MRAAGFVDAAVEGAPFFVVATGLILAKVHGRSDSFEGLYEEEITLQAGQTVQRIIATTAPGE